MLDVLRRFLSTRFLLTDDMADPAEIQADVEAGIAFRGTNLWVLIFAILVASVGLNVNSTAVIIGAMLISPLMGPIVGIGYGAATLELGLIERGLKSLLTASVFSLLVSALYFRLTPLTDAGSELLARTQPTTWDVLIALFGGAAGAVALTRKGHTNAIPGVAIATALMPPLCTAGYGLATAHWSFLFGALYLFSINCVFIALATFLVCRVLPLPKHTFVSVKRARRVQLAIWAAALLTAAPSVYLAIDIVRNGTFTHNAQRFVDEQLNLPGTFVVTSRILPRPRTLNVLLAGQQLTPAQLLKARAQLPRYRLEGAVLTVRQGLARLDSADTQALRSSVLEDVRSRQEQTLVGYETRLMQLQRLLAHPDSATAGLPGAVALLREVQVEHPTVRQLGLSRLVRPAADSLRADTTVLVAVRTRRPLPPRRGAPPDRLAAPAGRQPPARAPARGNAERTGLPASPGPPEVFAPQVAAPLPVGGSIRVRAHRCQTELAGPDRVKRMSLTGSRSRYQKTTPHVMKYFPTGFSCLFALVCLAGSGCSLGHSASDDLKSTNPAVALQAQKVVDLQQQVDAQEKAYNDQKNAVKDRERAVEKQKDEADIEKKRLEALKNQLDGAQQNLKGVKTQAKVQ